MAKQVKNKEKEIQEKRTFRREFSKSLHTGIVAALGIVVALTWKDVIDGYVVKIFELSPLNSKIVGAIAITLVATIIIVLISKVLND